MSDSLRRSYHDLRNAVVKHPLVVCILAPVALSVLSWLLPLGDNPVLQGFQASARTFAPAGLIIVGIYYALAALVADAGYRWGRRASGLRWLERTSVNTLEWASAIIGLIGTAYAVGVAWKTTGINPVEAARTAQFNLFRAGIPDSAGFATLRYTSTVAGGILLGRLIGWTRLSIARDGVAVLAFLMTLALGSRLVIIAALSIGVATSLAFRPMPAWTRRRVLTNVLTATILITAIVSMSWVRTAGTYREAGQDQVWQPAAYQVRAYLAAPMQGTVATADALANGTLHPTWTLADVAAAAAPSFVVAKDRPPVVSISDQEKITGINWGAFSTNGSFTMAIAAAGPLALLSLAVWLLVFALAVGITSTSGPVGLVCAGAFAFPFLDFWRMSEFTQGQALYLPISILSIAGAQAIVGSLKRRRAGT